MESIATQLRFQTNQIIQIGIAFLVLSWVAIALRVYTRTCLIKAFGHEDWAMLVAGLCFTGTVVSNVVLVSNVTGLYEGTFALTVDNISLLKTVVYVATALYGFTLIFLKISLSTFFLRIFVVQRWARIIIYVVLAETISYGLVYIIFSLASCGLNQAFSSNGGTCNQASAFLGITISAGLLNAITDLTFSVMAVIALWPANMSLSTKVIAILILIFGTVGGVASAIRIGYLIGNATRPLDITQSFGGSKWTLIECGIGITAASLATLRPLLRAIIGKAKSSPYSSTSTCANNLVPSALGADNKNNRVPDWREDSIAAPSGPESSDVEKGNGGHTSTGFALSMEGYDDQSSGQVLQTHNLLEGTPSNDHKRTSTIVEEKELCGS